MLYNILLLTNCYIGNNTTKCHSGIEILQRHSSENFFILQGHCISLLDISNPHEYAHNVTKYSILPLPVRVV